MGSSGEVRLPGRSPDAGVTLPLIPRSGPSGSRGHRYPSARDSRAFLRTGSEPGASSSGVWCMTAELRDMLRRWGGLECKKGSMGARPSKRSAQLAPRMGVFFFQGGSYIWDGTHSGCITPAVSGPRPQSAWIAVAHALLIKPCSPPLPQVGGSEVGWGWGLGGFLHLCLPTVNGEHPPPPRKKKNLHCYVLKSVYNKSKDPKFFGPSPHLSEPPCPCRRCCGPELN